MKKLTFFSMLFCASIANAQLVTNVQVSEVLASDNFETLPAWVNFDNASVKGKLALNNALGGTQTYQWADTWGGAAINSGADATGGNQTLQVHWGGYVTLNGFEIDTLSAYNLEVYMHPAGGAYGTTNYFGCIHLFGFQTSQIWQTQGVRVRITNGEHGDYPNQLAIDTWEGENGTGRVIEVLNFNNTPQLYYLPNTNPSNYWIKLNIVFSGAGTTNSPFLIDIYMNDKYVGSQSLNDIFWYGDMSVGLGSDGATADITKFDNFKLSKLKNATAVPSVKSDLKSFFKNSDRSINISNSTAALKVELFNSLGKNLYNCDTNDGKVILPASIQNGMYMALITGTNGTNSSLKFIVR